MNCSIERCESPVRARGWCSMHWQRWKRNGNPEVVSYIRGDNERRFWSKVNKTDTCWLWTSPLAPDGYARITVDGVAIAAHRWLWQQLNGTLAAGLQLDHKCHVRHCVNPAHLRPVSARENRENYSGLTSVNTSGFRGVTFHKGSNKWQAEVTSAGRAFYLGLFETAKDAGAAARAARNRLHTCNDLDRAL